LNRKGNELFALLVLASAAESVPVGASKTIRRKPVGALHEHAGLLDSCPERLRRRLRDGQAFIDRPVGLPVVGPLRPVAAAEADVELRVDVVGDQRLDLHAARCKRLFLGQISSFEKMKSTFCPRLQIFDARRNYLDMECVLSVREPCAK
jgi:hypothetical protein